MIATMRIIRALVLLAAAQNATSSIAAAQTTSELPRRIRDWVAQREPSIVRDAMRLFAMPNLASDSANIRRNAAYLVAQLEARGVTARILESPAGGAPAVLGELRVPGATKTVVLYAHYDGQPVATASWTAPPWEPTLRRFARGPGAVVPVPADGGRVDPELRIYARSSSDDKGPIVAMFAALDALRAVGQRPSVNVKFFFEGAEEAGSANLGPLLVAHRAALAADGWIFADGPVHVSGAPQLVLGVRGVIGVDITLFGATRALHSGHFGNWSPNPATTLSNVIASMRDADGAIRIKGFLDDVTPASAAERVAAEKLSATDDSVRRSLGLTRTEGGQGALALKILSPALNVRGLQSGAVGDAATNAIPTSATASIDFRLVPAQTPERVRTLVEQHLTSLGYTIVRDSAAVLSHAARERLALVQWDRGYRATRTSIENPFAAALVSLTARAYGRTPFVAPTSGGSLPMYLFEETLRVPLVVLPTVNADNNQHASDENIRVGNLFDAIVLFATVMAQLGTTWK